MVQQLLILSAVLSRNNHCMCSLHTSQVIYFPIRHIEIGDNSVALKDITSPLTGQRSRIDDHSREKDYVFCICTPLLRRDSSQYPSS